MINRMLSMALPMALCSLILGGCATTTNLDPENEVHYDASYDFSDKKKIVEKLVTPLITQNNIPPQSEKPILIVYPIVNETSEHISTGGISDDIRMKLLNSGKFRLISERQRENIQKETQYQQKGYVNPAQRIAMGKQLGAEYMISGTLRSIRKKEPRQWRLSKSERIYYSLDLSVTDLETGELIYADQAEIAREASRPFIGW
ncbi:membrane lipoprotein lipid attachment site [Oleiphilus messinensis]|uniref:Membrane lipoprotein lipid attachment site n=1 Tax=Oleiphilus messinensis TaxID=141451 RepID=A0A1Y0I411_9GAMM|nr:penicillin-binding protein activator LpoB [Oleiphilus messinensis]ARU55212.1 membrane lipoprotein lipid attachment site [Oleiphilus messinensis]